MKAQRIVLFAVIFFTSAFASAQNLAASENLRAWKRGTAIILFSGLAGGVLGLSTLSFYGEPEEHTGNVTSGALIGMLGGAGFLLWESSQRQSHSSWSVTSQRGEPALAYRYRF